MSNLTYIEIMNSTGKPLVWLHLTGTWRIIDRIDPDAIVTVEVFEKKKTLQTPRRVIELCQQRLRRCDALSEREEVEYESQEKAPT